MNMKDLIDKMKLETPDKVKFEDVDRDIFYDGPFLQWLKTKPETLTVEFEIKKRSIFNKIFNQRVKKYRVSTAVNNVISKVESQILKLGTSDDVEITLRICSLLILNKPGANERQINKVIAFLKDNASIGDLLILVDLLVKHTGCAILYNNFKLKTQK